MYQGMGFIVTTKPDNSAEVIEIFSKAGLTAARIGEITSDKKLTVKSGDDSLEFFDFNVDSITGVKPDHS
jgi:selenophosphate synthetase-related protein